jgi:hypothetical protein
MVFPHTLQAACDFAKRGALGEAAPNLPTHGSPCRQFAQRRIR